MEASKSQAEKKAESTVWQDLVALQTDLPTLISKDATNPFFKSGYLSLPKLLEIVRPIINNHGFSLLQHPEVQEGVPVLTTQLIHHSGSTIASTMLLQAKTSDPQSQGSAISYARRYAITSILGLAAEDDDGQSATEHIKTEAKPAAVASNPPQFDALTKVRGMFAIAKDQLGITDSEVAKSAIKRFAGIDSLNDLTYTKATEVLEAMRKLSPEEFAGYTTEIPF